MTNQKTNEIQIEKLELCCDSEYTPRVVIDLRDGEITTEHRHQSQNGCSPDEWHGLVMSIPLYPSVDGEALAGWLNSKEVRAKIARLVELTDEQWDGFNCVGHVDEADVDEYHAINAWLCDEAMGVDSIEHYHDTWGEYLMDAREIRNGDGDCIAIEFEGGCDNRTYRIDSETPQKTIAQIEESLTISEPDLCVPQDFYFWIYNTLNS